MNSVTISTEFSSSIRVKNKTFILALHTPEIINVYGPGIAPERPLILAVKNPDGEKTIEFDYTEEFIWDAIKAYKKMIKK